jgi:hypothetical protein
VVESRETILEIFSRPAKIARISLALLVAWAV